MKRNEKLFTTTDLSEMFGVARATVAKWVDSGQIDGFCVPNSRRNGGRDRRIQADAIVDFAIREGMPVPEEVSHLDRKILCVAVEKNLLQSFDESMMRRRIYNVDTLIDAAWYCGAKPPRAIILDLSVGTPEAVRFVRTTRDNFRNREIFPPIVAIAGEDAHIEPLKEQGFSLIIQKPFDIDAVTEQIAKLVKKANT